MEEDHDEDYESGRHTIAELSNTSDSFEGFAISPLSPSLLLACVVPKEEGKPTTAYMFCRHRAVLTTKFVTLATKFVTMATIATKFVTVATMSGQWRQCPGDKI